MSLSDSRFHWADYLVFALTLLLSSSVGVYYGIKDRSSKRNNIENFLLGGKSMPIFPVSVSMFVSWLSAISFLGDPVEVYYHGAMYWVLGVGYCLAVPPVAEYFAPKFHRLELYSAYQYLGDRYGTFIRLSLYSGIVLYAPSIALAQVSGISVWVSTVGIGLVCTFYTSLGGIKAVLWADAIQTVIMFVGLLVVLVRGIIVVGGLGAIWTVAERTGRLNFHNFNPSPFQRSTFWTYLIGGFFRVFNPYISSQTFVQRYATLRTPRDTKMYM